MAWDRGQGRAACALECRLLRWDGEKASEIELRSGVILKSRFPHRAYGISHKQITHILSLTVQWNLSGALFMYVTGCLRCPALPSLQIWTLLLLRQLSSCPDTCLSFWFWHVLHLCSDMCWNEMSVPLPWPYCKHLNHWRVMSTRMDGKVETNEGKNTATAGPRLWSACDFAWVRLSAM